jgi:hypothetical protein
MPLNYFQALVGVAPSPLWHPFLDAIFFLLPSCKIGWLRHGGIAHHDDGDDFMSARIRI